MNSVPHIEQLLVRSRRTLVVAIGLMLCVLVTVVGVTTWQIRQRIRDQIAGRDGEVLYAMALMHYAQDVKAGLGGPITDPGNQLSIVLRSSELRGVMGVRLFDPNGRYIESFPIDMTEEEFSKEDLPRLKELRPVTHFDPRVPISRLFYGGKNDPATGAVAVLEVNVPLHTPEGPLAGIAQFLLEGQSIAVEYARLDRHLAFQAGTAALAGSAILAVALGWAFGRLRRAHQLVAERTQNLLRANQELAFAAKTSALGAVTAHLIHGLKNPLAGLRQYVASRGSAPDDAEEADWRQAVATTRRMQETINQVVGVLREEQTGAAYEITAAELEQLVRARLDPLARERGVELESVVQAEASLPNRVANLVVLILVNLVQNAVQATPSGGSVVLAIRRGAAGLQLEVGDQGPGFPAHVPLFQPCVSNKDGGTGIGLALCKQLANHLGAELALARNGPEGCRFTLTLPVSVERPETLAPAG
jgi:signal transduction histidine kinase